MESSYPISVISLIMGIVLSGVAGYFSVIGIGTIFSGAFISAVVMAGALETSKIVAASWLYRNWRIAPVIMRVYMCIAVIVLVLITSMGIFGYLSKAHIEQTVSTGGNNELQIELLQNQVDGEIRKIQTAEKNLSQMDAAIETLIEYDRIRGPEGSIAVRETQQEERAALNLAIDGAYERIEILQEKLLPLQKQNLVLEVEVGPLKYIAELIYGKEDKELLEKAVRFVTLIIVLVFDPLAICMILAGNTGISHRRKKLQMPNGEIIDSNRVKNMS